MIGQLLADRYRIIEKRASNQFGITYLASDTYRPGYPYCLVKQLRPSSDSPKTPQMMRLLLRERVAIRHKLGTSDYVPAVLQAFEADQQFYMVEELVPGHPLSQELVPDQGLPAAQVMDLLQRMLEILVFIHSQNVIHQDIQPSHLICRATDGKLVLINFKLMREVTTPGVDAPARSPMPIAADALAYKPPEQRQGLVSPGNDIYAVGIIAIQALTGLSAEAIDAIQHQYSSTGKVSPWQWRLRVQWELADVIDKLVSWDAAERYQSAQDALLKLNRLIPIDTLVASIGPAPTPSLSAPATSPVPSGKTESMEQSLSLVATPVIAPATAMVVATQPQPAAIAQPPPDEPAVSYSPDAPSSQPTTIQSATLNRPFALLPLGGVALLGVGVIVALQQQLPAVLLAQSSLHQGVQLSQRRDFKGAIANFNQSIQTYPGNSDAFYNRGVAYYRLGNQQQALADLTQALQLHPTHAKAYLYRADTRAELGDNAGAVNDYNRAIQIDPKLTPAYLNRATVKAHLGDETAALADYNRAIELDANLVEAYLNRCLTRSNLNDQTGAIQDCTQAINREPTYALPYQNRGLAYRRAGNIKGAIADFNIAIRLNPKDADPYYNRGLARYELGDRQGALTDFNTTIQLNPGHTLVYYDRGLVQGELGNVTAAIDDFQTSAKLCLDQGRTDCYKDAQYQIKKLQQLSR